MSLVSECYSPDEMTLLFNQLYEEGIDTLVLEAAPFGFPLFQIKINSDVFLTVKSTPFPDYFADNSIVVPSGMENEIDKSNPWIDLLKLTGIIPPSNLDKIKKVIVSEFACNPLVGDPPTLLCMDTNLFRHRLYTHTLSRILSEKENQNLKPGFLLPETVQGELKRFNYKYKDAEVTALLNAVNAVLFSMQDTKKWMNHICGGFSNQNKFTDRKVRLGHQDFVNCMKFKFSTLTPSVGNTGDPDSRIIDEVKDYVKSKHHRIILLSEDRDFVARAQGLSDIHPQLVEFPPKNKAPEKFTTTWFHLSQLLYSAAIWFGGVLISEKQSGGNDPIFSLNGIWKGKTPEDWNSEYAKVTGSPDFLGDINTDLNLIRIANEKLQQKKA